MENNQSIIEEQQIKMIPTSQHVDISMEHGSNLDQSYYQINEKGVKVLEHGHQIKCLKKDKQYFIRQLLKGLGYSSTLNIFKQQCKTALHDKNPEEASNKKKIKNNKKQNIKQDQLKQIIQSSVDYDTMIESLQRLYDLSQMDEQQSYQQGKAKDTFEKKMKQLYSSKKQAIIPKYKNIQIHLKDKQVKFIDVNDNQDICLLDSQDYLHVLSTREQIRPFKVEHAHEANYLKWINPSTIFLVNLVGNVTVFVCQQNQLKIKATVPLKIPKIKRISVIVMKYPQRPHKEYVRILSKNENSQFIVCQITVEQDSIKFTGGTLFQSQYMFRSFNLLKVPKLNQQGQCIQETEHYYGLIQNGRSIVKFDTIVKKQGILWTTDKMIDSCANTKCRYFLIVLISEIKQQQRLIRKKGKLEKAFAYQFLKMNGHGSIVQRIPIDFYNPLLPNNFTANPTNIPRFKLMHPEWLTCFAFTDNIIYLSCKTGNVLHVQDLEENQLIVIGVGPTNCIVYKTEDTIFLLSTVYAEKKKVVLQKKRPMRDRQSLILRLTRNGIPQTLLQLLQQLRHNQIELVQR